MRYLKSNIRIFTSDSKLHVHHHFRIKFICRIVLEIDFSDTFVQGAYRDTCTLMYCSRVYRVLYQQFSHRCTHAKIYWGGGSFICSQHFAKVTLILSPLFMGLSHFTLLLATILIKTDRQLPVPINDANFHFHYGHFSAVITLYIHQSFLQFFLLP